VRAKVRAALRAPDREAQAVAWARFTRRWYWLMLLLSAAALAAFAAASPPWWLWPIVGFSALVALRQVVLLTVWLRKSDPR
jgi:hypothetical protein